MRQWMINLPDKDLAYLPQSREHFEDYVRAVHWPQDYALPNRDLMMRNMIAAVQGSGEVPAFEPNVEVVSCHHNYVTWDHHYGENVLSISDAKCFNVFPLRSVTPAPRSLLPLRLARYCRDYARATRCRRPREESAGGIAGLAIPLC